MRSLLFLFALIVTALATRTARASDPSTALDELKQGYALKQQGNCREAVAHFTRSFELEPKPKALLNLSDCERQMGDLVAAQDHAAYGRQLAQQQNDAELTAAADEQLAAIDKRLPRLTIRLSPGAPRGCTVSRDSVAVEMSSLGVPAGVNPGTHAVVVTAPGHADRRFQVAIAEGAREQIDAEPGPSIRVEAASVTPPLRGSDGRRRVSTLLTYGALGLGAAGITIGIATGIAAGSKHDTLQRECHPDGSCPLTAQGDLDSFRSLRTWSTVGYVIGVAALIGGAAFWLWLPQDRPNGPAARLWIGPASAGVGGAF